MRFIFRRLLASAVAFLLVTMMAARGAQPNVPKERADIDFFEKKVRPLLVSHCNACHSADTKPAGGLRVDDRRGLLVGGNNGPAIVPGKPDEGTLLRRITQKEAKRRMPRESKALSAEQVAILRKWIRDGAAWPAPRVPISLGKPKARYQKLRKEHWAYQPLTHPKVPTVRDTDWPRDAIDRFLLAKLEEKELRPVADAGRLALLRRVTFDLTGLPPAPAAIEAFLKDTSRSSFNRVVDRLLASTAFGERWGRHWLDVARYGESTGPSRNIPYPHAWRYRNYVIDSINADVPYDRFIREQIAGDLLPAKSEGDRDRLLTATGFLALGVKDVNQRFKVRFIMDNVDEQIDVVTRSVLGLTVSCARCHDHKFDPIPTTDYYALAGIFTSTDDCAGVRNQMGGGGLAYYVPSMLLPLTRKLPPPPAEKVAKLKEQVAKARADWDAIRGTPEGRAIAANGFPKQRPFRLKWERLRGELLALTDQAARGNAVHGARESSKTIGDTEVRLRGEAEKLGPLVPRGFLTAFEVPGAPKKAPEKQSGRLELAWWLTSPNNPLPARVAVNRVWQRLFGQGLVTTVDNFGVTGDRPSHPELLDHLANRFIRDGYSLKKLVRALVLTRAYQLSAQSNSERQAIDPGNRLVWRHSPRRLDAEEIRDAMLASSGDLQPGRPEGPVWKLPMIEIRDNGPQARTIRQIADRSTHRSIYLPLLRGLTPHALEVFDPVEQTLVTGQRNATTVPSQALYLLNSSFVRKQSLDLAERLLTDRQDGIRIAYRLILGRSASAREIERAKTFLTDYEWEYRKTPLVIQPGNPQAKNDPTKKPAAQPANPDEADQTGVADTPEIVQPGNARSAAWLALVQALYSTAEFRYLK